MEVVSRDRSPTYAAAIYEGAPGAVQVADIPELAAFANGLTSDLQAVRAALEQEWSNGQVEGQVHRLKLVKRRMYGRGKLDLLRA